ncbi:hypothetical protein QR680_014304 [Steinernema hermaphroditum]|uniref:Phlebovirus glycoprotein G2 fusion domain-containing protein n=1 Tax=Steinernema hermaphroditum TaxID=289476 RepID=A0AA39M404_9BILA|nr:hypothetical protein QR680_014304 [Steinernema hermaphroditum]
MVEVCSGKSCSYMQEPEKSQRLALPQEVMMFEHEVNVKMWKKGRLLQRIKKSCPSSPFCESFTCVVCLERLYNPQCISWVAIFLGIVAIGVTYYLLSILIKLLTISCMCCYFAFRWARGMKNWCCKYCRRDKTETVSIQLASSKSRFRYRPANSIATKIMIVMIVTLLTTGEDSCTDIVSLSGKTSECLQDRGGEVTCRFKESVRLSLTGQKSTACLILRDHLENIIGNLKIETQFIGLRCEKQSEFYTREMEVHTVSSKRCLNAGSCTEGRCEKVLKTDEIDELKGEAYERPGYTYCQPSCGCFSCGCFWCNSGCLFYRIYAAPTSSTLFEVFSCPVWKREARVKMELTIGNQTAETIENLVAGQRYGWNQLKVSLVTMDLSYSPVLNTHFVTDGDRVAFHRPTDKIFVCETSEAARDFNCTLSESACTCNARDESVRCTCSAGQKHLLTNDVLPQLIKGVYIQPRGASLLAHFKEEAAAQLQITLDEFSASAMTSNTACEIEVFDFKGCYNCKTGAQMTYRCQSDFATAQADVKCGTNQFLALCTEQGSIGETWLSFGSRLVQETCTVSCPRRQTTFALEGRLNYIADTDASSLTLIDTLDTVRNVNGSIPWDQLFGSLSFLSSFNIFGKLWSSLSNVMNGIVLVVVIWMALYVRTIVTRIRSLYHVVVPKKVL